jgi:multidrug efflux pump
VVPYDTSQFVEISIREVVKTLAEAMVLVFLVMYLFLGSLRATVIPTIVVPIALIGATVGLYIVGLLNQHIDAIRYGISHRHCGG